MYSSHQIREMFLTFFEQKGHLRHKSASLIPQNDPTLYFTNAGMVPFKNYFTGEETPAKKRAVSSQKCMRVSGKHNDLENVGRTARHHTFFEMLGNFSFGDYFKSEAIDLAYTFLTQVLKIDPAHLWVTVFENDDEAFDIWHKEQKVPLSRLVRLDEKDNFWSMGETGPCGPCSEIHFAFDTTTPLKEGEDLKTWFIENSDAGHIMEIWNLVFMQFDQKAKGERTPLPKPSIDTGMGLERITCVMQGVKSNYDTDLFQGLLKSISEITQKPYLKTDESGFSMRVLADHIRSSVFLIADGVLPSNEGRGYVLRRILRRAIRHGKILGQNQPFFYRLARVLIDELKTAYPELESQKATLEKVIFAEEERFLETLVQGLKILSEEISQTATKELSGAVAFKLYDTFGFPYDLTELMAQEHGLTVDLKGFEAEMQLQKQRARAHWKGTDQEKIMPVFLPLSEKFTTQFVGYNTLNASAKVLALIQNGTLTDKASSGEVLAVFDTTPFYAEGGGQVADTGLGSHAHLKAEITNTQKPVGSLFVHTLKITSGEIKVNDTIELKVNETLRKATRRNHSATHLLHAALRNILGPHVRQAGSLVTPHSLRFDFSHFEALTPAQKTEIEKAVNAEIVKNTPITFSEMPYDDALKKGALAFFGDKYTNQVRVLEMGDASIELCGGTHAHATGELGLFKIISESSVAAGVRRIEAISGLNTQDWLQSTTELLSGLSEKLKCTPSDFFDRLDKIQDQLKTKDKEIEKLKAQLLRASTQDLLSQMHQTPQVKAVYFEANVEEVKDLQNTALLILEKIKSGIAVVSTNLNDKTHLLVCVSKDCQASYPAHEILKKLAPLINGKGGGKADRAQAGGDNASGLSQIFNTLKETLS